MSGAGLVLEMQALEERLLHVDHAKDRAALERMLAPAFTEVNAAGGETSRDEVLRWLLAKDPAARWQLTGLDVQQLAGDLRMVRYHALQVAPQRSGSKGARHVSLWRFDSTLQAWQLVFHQATRVL